MLILFIVFALLIPIASFLDIDFLWTLGVFGTITMPLGWAFIKYLVFLDKSRERHLENLTFFKTQYEATLEFIKTYPEDPNARVNCLVAGRKYYSIILPDTHTIHFQNGMPAGSSDQQDNTAGREARIRSDIDAKIGHLQYKAS